ncbi:NADP-dependent oxidoreductase [Jiangella endophytica]|uniref:NADP-dependent oxidoreductase n=1 Tax=Jiangella endophytica TaxID=1623398 RepID=UPI000E351F47|nr:NADP-dependent oxidoreductase [Jiangella endophytica]
MRAATLESVPSSPSVSEVEAPPLEAGELLVRVESASVNGFDVATAAGWLQGMIEHRYPLVVGKDFAGTVTARGDGADGFAVGDAVFGVVMKPFLGAGSLAEFVTVPAAYGVAHIPDGLSVRDAGALGLAGTAALDSVNAVDPSEGETILICGATGGVGSLAVQLAAARGARVIATARPGSEAGFVTGLTAAEIHVVDHTGDLAAQVRAVAPDGVDTALHLAGDADQLAGLLRPGGRLASTLGVTPDGATAVSVMADTSPQTLARLAADAASGALRVPVTASYPLARIDEAFAAFRTGALGKIALTIA